MSIFDDNISKELTVGNVFNVNIDNTDFPFQNINDLCCRFFFKWVYYDCHDHAAENIIKRIKELPISLIESYLQNDNRPLRHQFKKFLKYKYSHTNTFWIAGVDMITIRIEEEMFQWGYKDSIPLVFKIVLTRL